MFKGTPALLNRAVLLLFFGVILFMLIVGLRPYSSYSKNWVSYDSAEQITILKHYGLATGELSRLSSTALFNSSVEISIAAKISLPPDNRFQVLAQIDSPGSEDPMIIGQWRSSLIVMTGRDYRNKFNLPRFSTNLENHLDSLIEIHILITSVKTTLKVNQRLMKQGPSFKFKVPPTRISIGNGPDGTHGWAGSLQYFRIRSMLSDRSSTLYQFDENNFPLIVDNNDAAQYLKIPKPGRFPDRVGIGSMSFNQLINQNLIDVFVNLLGFMPFGFLMCAVLAIHFRRLSTLLDVVLTVFTGFLFSLAIESAQTYIPGRSPHAHDLFLNTLGAAGGAIALLLLCIISQRYISRTKHQTKHPKPPENH